MEAFGTPLEADSSVKIIARFKTEVRNGSPKNAAKMTGKGAILSSEYGLGRLVLISPHPESTHCGNMLSPTPGEERVRRVVLRALLFAVTPDIF